MGESIYTKAEREALIGIPAIVERADGQLDLEIGNAWHALRLAEQRETKTAEKATQAQDVARKASEEAGRKRLELGRLLIEKHKAMKIRQGDRSGRWAAFLDGMGIPTETARRYMALAGYVATSPTEQDEGEVPTYAEAGIDNRPRVTDPRPESTCPNCWQIYAGSGHICTKPTGQIDQPDRAGGRGKPQWLMRALVRDYTIEADLVCDPLAGWGSTLRAALDEGRRAIGSEIDPKIAAEAGELPIVVGDWRIALADTDAVDAIIVDPPYSARTHEASRKFGNAREDGSPLDGLGPEYAAWTRDHVFDFVRHWSDRCRGWMVALTDHNLIHDWQAAYEEAGRYSFAPVVCMIRGMTVRLCGDGPSSWALYAMVARPREMSRWRTTPGGYIGTRDRLEIEGDI